jgi:hypothetical protein
MDLSPGSVTRPKSKDDALVPTVLDWMKQQLN